MRRPKIPVAEIQFAAKAGFLSRPIWEKFFATGTTRLHRMHWQFFTKRGFFVKHPSRITRDVLILNRKSPEVKSIVGETISTHPFVSQLEHDESVARILLALARHPKVLGYRLEAELKREEWVEKRLRRGNAKDKFPDGVIEIYDPKGSIKIAIEVEISRKDRRRYREILTAYTARKDLAKVLFLARSKPIFENLKTAMHETYYPDWERPIGFCDLDSWLENPTNAPIYFSDGITTFEKIAAAPERRPGDFDRF